MFRMEWLLDTAKHNQILVYHFHGEIDMKQSAQRAEPEITMMAAYLANGAIGVDSQVKGCVWYVFYVDRAG